MLQLAKRYIKSGASISNPLQLEKCTCDYVGLSLEKQLEKKLQSLVKCPLAAGDESDR